MINNYLREIFLFLLITNTETVKRNNIDLLIRIPKGFVVKSNEFAVSTFDRIINNDPKRKKELKKKYNSFLLSEFMIEAMEENGLSVRELSKKTSISTSIIHKLRKGQYNITLNNLEKILRSLGYDICFKKDDKFVQLL